MKSAKNTKTIISTQKVHIKKQRKKVQICKIQQKKKLLEYHDYLINLRKMDLGNLIEKHRQCRQKRQQNSQFMNQKINVESTPPIKQSWIKAQSSSTIKGSPSSPCILSQNISSFLTSLSNHQNKQLPKLKLQQIQENLFCDQSIDDLLNHTCRTPQLRHLTIFNQRDLLTTRSRKNTRDGSMPSIQENNDQDESQEALKSNHKHIRNNSYGHTQSLHYNPQITQFTQVRIPSSARLKANSLTLKKTHNKQNPQLHSTCSSLNNHKNKQKQPQIQPFQVNLDQKLDKIQIDVSAIVRRLNPRDNKSSMSDRTYRKQICKQQKQLKSYQQFKLSKQSTLYKQNNKNIKNIKNIFTNENVSNNAEDFNNKNVSNDKNAYNNKNELNNKNLLNSKNAVNRKNVSNDKNTLIQNDLTLNDDHLYKNRKMKLKITRRRNHSKQMINTNYFR